MESMVGEGDGANDAQRWAGTGYGTNCIIRLSRCDVNACEVYGGVSGMTLKAGRCHAILDLGHAAKRRHGPGILVPHNRVHRTLFLTDQIVIMEDIAW